MAESGGRAGLAHAHRPLGCRGGDRETVAAGPPRSAYASARGREGAVGRPGNQAPPPAAAAARGGRALRGSASVGEARQVARRLRSGPGAALTPPGPGYKEKLPSKSFREHSNKARFSDSLNSQRWRFLKSGLDDFRSGVPAPSDNIIIRGTKGLLPIVLPNNASDASRRAQQKVGKTFTRQSRLSPLQKARQDHIAQTEHCLNQHPLALYPHLEESIPPELFEEVVAILDPELCLHSKAGYKDRDQASHTPQQELFQLEDGKSKEISPRPSALPGEDSQLYYKGTLQKKQQQGNLKQSKSKSPYSLFSKKEVAAREKAARRSYIPPLDENVKRVTKEFCDWVASWGGENYNISEDTIMRLFDTGYETKPTPAMPVEVVEINNVPPELRKRLGVSSSLKAVKSLPKGLYQPKWEKIRYGAWYLDPKMWIKQKVNEPLEDPKEAADTIQNLRKRFSEKETEVMQLHGTHAFKEFLERKGYRKPEFLLQMLAAKDGKGAKEETWKGLKETQEAQGRFSLHTR
ncbi:protein FAM47E [Eretmochelys imbricata]